MASYWLYYDDTDRSASGASYYPNSVTRAVRFSFANASSIGTGGNYAGVMHFHPWDGNTSSTGDASYQLAFGSSGTNASGIPQLALRKGIDTTWNSWYYIPAYDINYKAGALYPTIVYDGNDTSYYVDPNSTSQLSYVLANNWFRAQGSTGLYFQSYAMGLWPVQATSGSYGNVSTYGTGYNGWTGYNLGGQWTLMNSGNGDNIGIHSNSSSWLWYWDGSSTQWSRGYTQFAGSARAPIFYDSNDTGYYIDPNTTSDSALRIRGGALHGPNPTWGAYLLVGGDGRNSYVDNGSVASVCSTNGNLHMDAASGYDMFLNYYDGANIQLGNGAYGIIGVISAAGNLTMNGNITASSDIRLKTNIKTIQNALSIVSRMRGVYFNWIESGNQSIGLIAQEVQEVIPELVLENIIKNPPSFPGEKTPEDRILSVDYGKIVSVLIEAIKEQQKQIEEQNKRIAFLETK